MNLLTTGSLSRMSLLALIALSGNSVMAQGSGLEIGPRVLLLLSQGEPSNDMAGGGIVANWHWRDDWYFGAAIDTMNFDYERPQRELQIVQPANSKTIDGSNSWTRLSGWIERRYERDSDWTWFWGAGLGYASVEVDPFVTGPVEGGGTFNITTTASDEIHLMTRLGLRRPLFERWAFVGTFHLEHHLTDYKIRDTVSGATGKIGSHTPVGLSATFSYRF